MSTPASPRVTAVVVSYNTRDDLLRCLAALARVAPAPHVIVVDNASTDGSVPAVREAFPSVTVLANAANEGFSRANNRGLREARTPYVLVLNSDAEVRPGAVEALEALLEARPDVGLVGPRTVGSDGRIQVSFGPMLGPIAEWRQRRRVRGVKAGDPDALRTEEETAAREQEPVWVSASCFLARREALAGVGFFDEGFFLYEEDVDLCVRLRASGWRVLYSPRAEVVHHLGRSMEQAPARARLEDHRSHLRFYDKHLGLGARAALRALLLARGGFDWLRAGADPARRAEAAALLRLVFR